MRFACLSFVSVSLALSAAGCVVLVDGALAGRTGTDAGRPPEDAGIETDSGPPVGACTGMPDGLRCAPDGIVEPFVCLDDVCVLSTCGDGIPDDRDGSMHDPEECDDGNETNGDGCELDCTFSCNIDSDCSDSELCTGEENCQASTHACEAGTAAVDGTICMIDAIAAACRGGVCRAGACPDGIVDAGEECDPGSPVEDDGCEDDCTFTCVTDTECQDDDPCNGAETCTVAAHTCAAAAETLTCDDADPCTSDSCSAAAGGCSNVSVLIDGDMDGHFATTASCGGDDCNDANPLAYAGAPEACGATSDLNCDGMMGAAPTYYRDCDGDSYAPSGAVTMMSCTPPTGAPSGCSAGRWISVAPTSTTRDCLDTSSSVRPGQTSYFSTNATGLTPAFDYNCSGTATHLVTEAGNPYIRDRTFVECHFTSGGGLVACTGTSYWVETRPPTCGSMGTQSRCAVVTGEGCTRITEERVATCR